MKQFVTICLLLVSSIVAQTIEFIKTSPDYIWGEGIGHNLAQADRMALKDLSSLISVQIESSFSQITTETNTDVSEYAESVVKSYSATTLNQAQRKVVEKDGMTIVLRYMEKANVEKLFETRKLKLLDYLSSAHAAEADYRLGDALKYYYWTLVLLRSHPEVNTLVGPSEKHEDVILISYLPERIEQIFQSMELSVSKVILDDAAQKKTVLLEMLYKGTPITNLDYIYYTGDSWTNRFSNCRDGLGVVEYFGASAEALKTVRLKFEYIYESKSKIDNELKQIIEQAMIPYFPAADFKVPIYARVETPKASKPKIEIPSNVKSKRDHSRVVADVVKAIQESDYREVVDHFTPEGKQMFLRMLEYGRAELIDPGQIHLQMATLNEDVIVRAVPMKFSFPNSDREFIEDVVFILNADSKIEDVAFALSDRAISDIMGKSDRFGSLEHKQQIIRFMENYKTAYCLERLDYIESIFADNALILVGNSIKQGGNIDGMYGGRLRNEDIQYIKLNKSEYIERLRRIFANNEFVNIQFEETNVKKLGGKDRIYGIQIAQNYNSMSYADFGYLFLMFDLNDTREPKIYVRSWQPEKNAEGRIMGLEDFTF